MCKAPVAIKVSTKWRVGGGDDGSLAPEIWVLYFDVLGDEQVVLRFSIGVKDVQIKASVIMHVYVMHQDTSSISSRRWSRFAMFECKQRGVVVRSDLECFFSIDRQAGRPIFPAHIECGVLLPMVLIGRGNSLHGSLEQG